MNKIVSTTLTLCLAAGIIHADMSIKVDEKTQCYTIQDSGKPVLTYNFGTVPVPEGVSGKYAVARGNYVHPLYGPDGEVLTLDFSKDHPHHRGIYWAWPEVTYKGEMRDIHALQGVFARPVKIHKQSADKNSAVISAENVWKWGDIEEIVREFATITSYPAKNGLSITDFSFSFEALKPGITIARRGKTHYGGFNVRMSEMDNIKIVKHTDKQGSFPCKAWAELTATQKEGKQPVGIFILQNPANPLYPGDWVEYANLPWLQPTFPAAGMAYAFKPGQHLKLSFRVIVRSDKGLKVQPATLFADYAGKMTDPLAAVAGYKYGESRAVLTTVEQAIRDQTNKERVASEKRILDVLSLQKTSIDFQCWAFRQLQLCGSDACVPVAATYLDKDSWMQALDAVIAVPGEISAKAMISALPKLPAERQAAVIQAHGMRRDQVAVTMLAKSAAGNETITAATAISALGRIGSPAAAMELASLKVIPELNGNLIDAMLQCAESPVNSKVAQDLYRSIWKKTSVAAVADHQKSSAQHAAALIGLAQCTRSALPEIVSALSSDDAQIRNGAAAALNHLDRRALASLSKGFANMPDASKLIVMGSWSTKEVRDAEASIIKELKSANPEVQKVAVRALRKTGAVNSVASLLSVVSAGGGVGAEAKVTLTQISGKGIFEALVEAIKGSDPKIAKAALKAVSDRRDPGYASLMMEMAKYTNNATATSALGNLRNIGTAKELPALRKILVESDDALKPSAAAAIVLICKREPARANIEAVLNGKPELTGSARTAMISALPEVGGDAALAFVCKTQGEPSVRALLKWPDQSAIKSLQSIVASKAVDDKLNKLASAGLLRLVKNTVPATAQGRFLKASLPNVRDETVKRQISDYFSELNKVNIAKGKPITASHPWQAASKPELAIDGNINTYWSCAHSPTSVTVDLGADEKISTVKVVNYFRDKRYYQYTVEISTDNKSWKQVADMSKNTAPATEAGTTHKFESASARYVRVTMLKNSANPGMHIVELEVTRTTRSSSE